MYADLVVYDDEGQPQTVRYHFNATGRNGGHSADLAEFEVSLVSSHFPLTTG